MAKAVHRLVAHDKARPPKHLVISASVTPYNLQVNPTNIWNGNPQIFLLNPNGPRATNETSRLADEVTYSRLNFKILLNYGINITGDTSIYWMLLRQKSVKGTALTAAQFATDWFGDVTPCGANLRAINNTSAQSRYTILKRGSWHLKETVIGVIEQQVQSIQYYKPVKTSYVLGNAGTIADIDEGALYLFIYSDYPTSTATNGINGYGEGYLWFRDSV
jgi:hypothetical protein